MIERRRARSIFEFRLSPRRSFDGLVRLSTRGPYDASESEAFGRAPTANSGSFLNGRATLMSKILASAAFAMLGLAAVTPASAGDPRGNWLSENGRAKVAIVSCGGALCGNIVALKEPNDPATGKPKTDSNNPDAAKRARPMIGVQIVIDMKPDTTADKWKGEVYNTEDGKTYSGSITLVNAATLNLQGCALGGLICKTQTWTRTN
jgi:uncharacterized protein (DUF2147 family)